MRRASTVLAYVTCCALWGSTWMVIKVGLEDLPPLRFAAVRMACAFALLTPFALRTGLHGLRGGAWRWLAMVGALNLGISFAMLFVGQRYVSSGLAAIFFATFPVWMVVLGRLFFPDQKLTLPRLVAGPLGLAGIALIQLPNLTGVSIDRGMALGGGLVILAAILIALANVLMRKRLVALPAVVSTWGQTGMGALVIGALMLLFERGEPAHWTPRALSALVYLVVFGTVVTYVTFNWLVSRLSLAAVGAIPLLDTLVAVLLGAVFLDEPLGWIEVGASVLILTAAALANLSPEPASKAPPEPVELPEPATDAPVRAAAP
jgi:drug/metabolite transporter (DMT)-like permease